MAGSQSEVVLTVRPDSKGRIALGRLAKGVSSYRVHEDADGTLVLEPYTEIPAKEQWLYKNRAARASVERGVEESAAGKAKSAGSFATYADNSDE
jgi:hypothetical protein